MGVGVGVVGERRRGGPHFPRLLPHDGVECSAPPTSAHPKRKTYRPARAETRSERRRAEGTYGPRKGKGRGRRRPPAGEGWQGTR